MRPISIKASVCNFATTTSTTTIHPQLQKRALQPAKMPYHLYNPFVTNIPRPSNLNYSQFVESVNRTMNASQAPLSSFFGSAELTNKELHWINGTIPLIHADVHDATERLEIMHLDLYAEWHAPHYRSQTPLNPPLSMPPTPHVNESRSRSGSPYEHSQGPRPKPLSRSALAATMA